MILRLICMHVDNVILGCDSEAGVLITTTHLHRSIMGQAKFKLWSWTSNSAKVQYLHSSSLWCMYVAVERDYTTYQRPAVAYNFRCFLTCLLDCNWRISINKQEILQSSSSMCNALSLITPITIQAKILLQELWKRCIDWDELLLDNWRKKETYTCCMYINISS